MAAEADDDDEDDGKVGAAAVSTGSHFVTCSFGMALFSKSSAARQCCCATAELARASMRTPADHCATTGCFPIASAGKPRSGRRTWRSRNRQLPRGERVSRDCCICARRARSSCDQRITMRSQSPRTHKDKLRQVDAAGIILLLRQSAVLQRAPAHDYHGIAKSRITSRSFVRRIWSLRVFLSRRSSLPLHFSFQSITATPVAKPPVDTRGRVVLSPASSSVINCSSSGSDSTSLSSEPWSHCSTSRSSSSYTHVTRLTSACTKLSAPAHTPARHR